MSASALDSNLWGKGWNLTWLKIVLVSVFAMFAPLIVWANIGTVISVKQGADVTRAGNTQPLRMGMEVLSGDSITTDAKGVVQLVFVDDTKIAIGPNARMVLDVKMLRGNRKAKTFAVEALGGSFRFISGKSRKRAYSIKTPTATMAVRGTVFDMWVASENQSAMVVLHGTVQMCGRNGSCRSTGRVCSLYATGRTGTVGRPVDQAQYDKAMASGFPFIQSQKNLRPPLQVAVEGCSGESQPVSRAKSDAPEPRRARPEPRRAEPDPPRPAPEKVRAKAAAKPTPPSRPDPVGQFDKPGDRSPPSDRRPGADGTGVRAGGEGARAGGEGLRSGGGGG